MCTRIILALCWFIAAWALAWPKPDVRYERSPDMATLNAWQGTTGNYDTAGNWTNGAKPAASDFVVLDGSLSQQSITSGHGDESAISIGGLWCKRNYRGDFGSSSTPWDISFDAATFILWEGSGSLHISADNSAVVVCSSPNAVDAINLYGTEAALVSKRGAIVVTATHAADITSFDMIGGIVTIAENGSFKVGNIRMIGGEVTCSRDWTATAVTTVPVISGGHWHQLINGPDAGLTMLVQGGLVTWDAPASAGHIPALVQQGGLIDFNNTADAKTVGTYIIFGGDDARSSQLTVTSETDYRKDFPE